ncbi:hypothetical protein B0H16DRAFT_862795 [Mycena metata]|uniref:Uncharacterized protein n=1 Tax=Mycena metata TaxID=1033252 RepID=A0AAD7N8L9_9AGAR|nr:hypothetical protein B0H16DRAFT_862795 [Mycena metata]
MASQGMGSLARHWVEPHQHSPSAIHDPPAPSVSTPSAGLSMLHPPLLAHRLHARHHPPILAHRLHARHHPPSTQPQEDTPESQTSVAGAISGMIGRYTAVSTTSHRKENCVGRSLGLERPRHAPLPLCRWTALSLEFGFFNLGSSWAAGGYTHARTVGAPAIRNVSLGVVVVNSPRLPQEQTRISLIRCEQVDDGGRTGGGTSPSPSRPKGAHALAPSRPPSSSRASLCRRPAPASAPPGSGAI